MGLNDDAKVQPRHCGLRINDEKYFYFFEYAEIQLVYILLYKKGVNMSIVNKEIEPVIRLTII